MKTVTEATDDLSTGPLSGGVIRRTWDDASSFLDSAEAMRFCVAKSFNNREYSFLEFLRCKSNSEIGSGGKAKGKEEKLEMQGKPLVEPSDKPSKERADKLADKLGDRSDLLFFPVNVWSEKTESEKAKSDDLPKDDKKAASEPRNKTRQVDLVALFVDGKVKSWDAEDAYLFANKSKEVDPFRATLVAYNTRSVFVFQWNKKDKL